MALKFLILALALAVCVVDGVAADGLPRAAEEAGFSTDRLALIDRVYRDKVSRGEIAGITLLISRHGKIVHFSVAGYADVERKIPMERDTIVRLYSMTKPVAAVALMMLYEEGRFQMSDPIAKYIPEFSKLRALRTDDAALNDTVPLERPPTIEDLMRHTAGFTHGLTNNAVDREYLAQDLFAIDVSLAEMVDRLSKIPLAHQPGAAFSYGVSSDVQARLVEILSGMAFDDFLQMRLFKPLGMKDTGFWVNAEKVPRLATVHWEKSGRLTPLDDAHGYPADGRFLTEPRSVNSYTKNHKRKGGSYGLVGTAEDYWRFAQMMANRGELNGVRILSPATVQFMTRDHTRTVEILDRERRPTGIGWGLGFAIMKDPVTAGYLSSEGMFFWSGAAGTHFFVDPSTGVVAVAMTQHMGNTKLGPIWAQIPTLVNSALME
jgi:CubicO group peptidase (beta-lactamase class C family)